MFGERIKKEEEPMLENGLLGVGEEVLKKIVCLIEKERDNNDLIKVVFFNIFFLL
jgi:hypothetical protein